MQKSEDEWKKELTPEQYEILRGSGTETAFTGQYWDNHEPGKYLCAACGAELFASKNKFDSGTGWPSFDQPAGKSAVATESDMAHGLLRIEVRCSRCGGHLGHVFNDGPRETTGERFCINSAALKFIKEGDK